MFTRLLKYSVKNILRNKFLSISSVLVLTLLMFFINLLLVLHHTSFKLIDYVNDKMSISLYLNDWYDKNSSDVIEFLDKLKNNSNNANVKYKSKEEVLDEIRKEDIELVRILEKQNPLPNTISISNIALSNYERINSIIEWKMYLFSSNKDNNLLKESNDSFASYKSQYTRIVSVTSILNILQMGLYCIIWIFIFAIAIITYSIIWNFIYYYKDEIYITKLVWWSKAFIYGPFSLQWMIYSIIAFIISLIMFYLFIRAWAIIFTLKYSLDFLYKDLELILLIELLLFVLIGAISWYFSSKKYLK